jgi:hypothetical protein
MTLIQLVLLLLPLLIQGYSFAQKIIPNLRENLKAKLEVTTSVIEQKICQDDYGAFDAGGTLLPTAKVELKLRIRIYNSGDYSIILHKKSLWVAGYNIAHTKEDAEARRYELETVCSEVIWKESKDAKEGDFPSDLFVIIKPRESYEDVLNTRLSLYYKAYIGYSYSHYSTTEHFLRFNIWTTGGTSERLKELEELRAQWIEHGYLWLEGATSQAMGITLPKAESLMKCH